LANFLSISPNQTKFFCPLFAWSQLDISAISDSVSAVSFEGHKLNYLYSWILKLLKVVSSLTHPSNPSGINMFNLIFTSLPVKKNISVQFFHNLTKEIPKYN
jgi:hypothetical protein